MINIFNNKQIKKPKTILLLDEEQQRKETVHTKTKDKSSHSKNLVK
jgi:hypothetical protein